MHNQLRPKYSSGYSGMIITLMINFVLYAGCESDSEGSGDPSAGEETGGRNAGGGRGGDVGAGQEGGGEEIRSPYFDVETPQLDVNFDDPTDPRTISAAQGLRRVAGDTPRGIRLYFGPNVDPTLGEHNYASFTMYSPDDANFAFIKHTTPVEMYVDEYPDDYQIPGSEEEIKRYEVTLFFEQEMKEGKRYYIRGIGGVPSGQGEGREIHRGFTIYEGAPMTSGRHAVSFVYPDENAGEMTDERIASVAGVRAVTQITDSMIKLELGHTVRRDATSEPLYYTLSSEGDVDFAEPVHPDAVYHKDYTERVVPNQREYPYTGRLWATEVYLKLPATLKPSQTYTVSLNEDLIDGRRELTFTTNEHGLLNHYIKISQEGYPVASNAKWAYVGAWLGTKGTLDMDGLPETCLIIDESGEQVLEVSLRSRLNRNEEIEGPYELNLAREDIYTCDFSALQTAGTYRVSVPGWGYSYPFELDPYIYDRTFHVTMKGLLYQRGADDTSETLNLFRKPLGHQEDVDIPYMPNRPIFGGHHDAGDINPRSRFEIAWILLEAYQHNPEAFRDGDLDIPEKNNGIPDILDEAAWAIRLLIELQADDGGVSGEEESWVAIEHPFDPTYIWPAERDGLVEHAYDKSPKTTFALAALAATASRLYADLGEDGEANRYKNIATKAYEWGVQHSNEKSRLEHAWAAAELLHLTGDSQYNEDYLNGYIFSGDRFEEIFYYNAAPAMSYARTRMADTMLRLRITDGIIEIADWQIRVAEKYGYAHVQLPYSPTNWGTGAYPNGTYYVMFAYMLTDDDKYLRWLEHSASFMLGANALNLTWVTGLGDRPVYESMHLWGWTNYTGIMPPGLQVEGPNNTESFERYLSGTTPDLTNYPTYHRYFPVRYNPVLNEGVSVNMGFTAAHFALLYAEARR